MRILTRLLILGVLAVLMAPLAAHAGSTTSTDATGDADGFDITSVKVHNSAKKVVVRVNWKNNYPQLSPQGAVKLWIDSDPRKKGPEFLYHVEYIGHSQFYPVKNWKPQYGKAWFDLTGEGRCGRAVKNADSMTRTGGYAKITLKARKGCFGKPKKVRAAAKTEEHGYLDADYIYHSNGQTIVDWYAGKKTMTRWTRR